MDCSLQGYVAIPTLDATKEGTKGILMKYKVLDSKTRKPLDTKGKDTMLEVKLGFEEFGGGGGGSGLADEKVHWLNGIVAKGFKVILLLDVQILCGC